MGRETITTALKKAQEGLPVNIQVKPEHLLLAGTPRRKLNTLIHEATGAANAAKIEYEAQGLRLEDASQRYLAVTPTPNELLQDTEKTSHARGDLERASAGFNEVRQTNIATQNQLELAKNTKAEARRLSRVPQALLAVSLTAFLGGTAFAGEQSFHDQSQHILASGKVQPGTERYKDAETGASNIANGILEGGTEGATLALGVFTWLAVSDRPARSRARITVALAKRKAS